MQLLLELQELVLLLGGQLRDRNTGDLGDDLRDMIGAHLGGRRSLVALPDFQKLVQLLLLLLQLLLQFCCSVELLAGCGIVLLALDLRGFGLQLLDIHRARCRADLHPCGCLIDQVDRLVGHEAASDVAIRKLGRCDDGLVGDRHLVVRLQRVAQAAQDHDDLSYRGFLDINRLEPSLERRVLLDVFLVLVERRRTDQV
ncbi:hypothetical protein D3C73_955950 [compost metagenome]